MAKKKISEDEIRWILSINANEAQQEIHKLTKSNKDLSGENRRLQRSMDDLAAAGKKDSIEFKNLDTIVKANNKTISENKSKVDALEKSLGLSALTMNQLRKRAKELKQQLDGTSQALNPTEYAQLESELGKVNTRMIELKNNGKKTGDSLGSVIQKHGAVATFLGNLWIKAFQWGKQAYDQMKEFVSNGNNLAASLEGIQDAFNRFATRDDLKKLRVDTKGLVSDFQLIKASVRAKNFDIPLGQLGKLLQFAHQRSKDTGESVDYMVNSIVDGIGRKSTLILDNLGISASKLNAEVKKTGDFASAVAKIVDEEMSKVGNSIDTAADVATRKAVVLENLQLALGQRTVKFKEAWDKMTTGIIENITQLVAVEKSHKDQYEDQIKKVADLEVNTATLVRRYDELKGKTSLSKDENVELNKVINSLRSAVPGIATEFDKYGNVLSVNTQKVWDFIDAEKAKLSVMNKASIDEQTKKLENYKIELEKVKGTIADGNKLVMTPSSMFAPGNFVEVALTNEEIEAYEKKQSELMGLITGTQKWIEDMNGTSIENQVKTQRESLEKRNEFNSMTKKQLDEYIKINKDTNDKYIELASEVYNFRFGSGGDDKAFKKKDASTQLKDFDNEQAQELAILKKYKLENQELEEDYQAKVLDSNIKHYDKRLELLKNFKKQATDKDLSVDLQKQIIDTESKRLEAEQQLNDLSLTILKKNRDEQLKIEENSYKAKKAVLTKQLAERNITQEQYDALMLTLDSESAKERLDIQTQYQGDTVALEKITGTAKAKAVEEANAAVMDADLKAAQARANQQKKLQNLLKDFKSEFNITTVDEDTDLQLKVLEASYKARKEMAEQSNIDTLQLDNAYETAKTKILKEAEEKRQQIRKQYGLNSWKDEFEAEKEALKEAFDSRLLSEKEYQDALFQLKVDYQKKYIDYFQNLMSNAINSLQNAEIASVEAKYDAEIARAQGNAEEVERLENEKERKKLEVQKKYAGVQFAIKVSEILANTAVSIMKAYADLGPIAGSIAAAMLTVTGAAQVALANAERKKVMNMSVGNSGSSSQATSGKRVVKGLEAGGYMDVTRAQDGQNFHAQYSPDKRGFVNRPTVIVGESGSEWVASNDAVNNPTVRPLLNIMNAAQEKGVIRTIDMNRVIRRRMAGFASGGYIGDPAASVPTESIPTQSSTTPSLDSQAIRDFNQVMRYVAQYGIRSFVLLSDLYRQQEMDNKSKNIASKS